MSGSISNEVPKVQLRDLPFQSVTWTDLKARTFPERKVLEELIQNSKMLISHNFCWILNPQCTLWKLRKLWKLTLTPLTLFLAKNSWKQLFYFHSVENCSKTRSQFFGEMLQFFCQTETNLSISSFYYIKPSGRMQIVIFWAILGHVSQLISIEEGLIYLLVSKNLI